MASRAWMVVDLGFGDAGKGAVTDHLVRHEGARWVIRFNGGAQAGHNVVSPQGRHHTFSQLGAGTFVPGVRTYLAPPVVFHPGAVRFEAAHLREVGVEDALSRLHLASTCRVTTPFHQALGRLRELARGASPHGTCGVGVGETVRDALDHPGDVLRAGDLRDADPGERLERIRHRCLRAAEALALDLSDPRCEEELALLRDPEVVLRWRELIAPVLEAIHLEEDEALDDATFGEGPLVFEGAQGVLLDERAGFHPHTTWSRCTSEGAEGWLAARALPQLPLRLGVLRIYATRHGPGPFPSEAPELASLLPEPHNGGPGWQGSFRRGWLDPPLVRYAIAANGGIDGLALTHLDRLGALPAWQQVEEHEGLDRPLAPPPAPGEDLEAQAALGRALASATARLAPIRARGEAAYLAWLERTLEAPVRFVGRGPASGALR
ncbi:MAG: adenylosuccinate synthetase [Deltaproteobacteria bacterium]|nr:adenylosuccinate synthetase [Deltaproteobacteria bacterium]